MSSQIAQSVLFVTMLISALSLDMMLAQSGSQTSNNFWGDGDDFIFNVLELHSSVKTVFCSMH